MYCDANRILDPYGNDSILRSHPLMIPVSFACCDSLSSVTLRSSFLAAVHASLLPLSLLVLVRSL